MERREGGRVVVAGLDLGHNRHFTALEVLERAPLGTPYPEIVERVRRTTRAPELDGRRHLVVDLPRRVHDDLVFAVALAYRAARKLYPRMFLRGWRGGQTCSPGAVRSGGRGGAVASNAS